MWILGSAPWEAKVQAERERWEEERQASNGLQSLWGTYLFSLNKALQALEVRVEELQARQKLLLKSSAPHVGSRCNCCEIL